MAQLSLIEHSFFTDDCSQLQCTCCLESRVRVPHSIRCIVKVFKYFYHFYCCFFIFYFVHCFLFFFFVKRIIENVSAYSSFFFCHFFARKLKIIYYFYFPFIADIFNSIHFQSRIRQMFAAEICHLAFTCLFSTFHNSICILLFSISGFIVSYLFGVSISISKNSVIMHINKICLSLLFN